MTTLLDYKTTLAYLAYLGYPDEPRTDALQVTRPRKVDRRKGKSARNVFLCYFCGAAGSGKTSLLRAFAGKPFSPVYEPTKKMNSVVNSVDIDGSEKYLVVRVADALADRCTAVEETRRAATRVWLQVRGRDAPESEEDRPRGRHRVCSRLERHELVLVHQQSAGAWICLPRQLSG